MSATSKIEHSMATYIVFSYSGFVAFGSTRDIDSNKVICIGWGLLVFQIQRFLVGAHDVEF